MRIKVLLDRDEHPDLIYGTGLVWARGEVHDVKDTATARKMVREHPQVYAFDDTEPGPGDGDSGDGALTDADVDAVPGSLESKSIDELREYAQIIGLPLDGRWGRGRVIAEIREHEATNPLVP